MWICFYSCVFQLGCILLLDLFGYANLTVYSKKEGTKAWL